MKDIGQYIHLYLGCKFQWKDGDGEWRKPQMLTAYQLSNIINNWVEVKLILRPLSSMTEEDGVKIFGSKNKYLFYQKEKEENAGDLFLFTPNEFAGLLREGFDLYNLIESNLAVASNKK